MIDESVTVDEFLSSLRVVDPQRYKNLIILPLLSDKVKDLKLKSLEEALESDTIEISELDGGGSVPSLRFINKGDEPVLILDGSIIKGNQQDRTIRRSIIVPAHETAIADVFCVEEGRWSASRDKKPYKPDHNISADIRLNFSSSDQTEIWRKLKRKATRMNSASKTEAIDQLYQDYEKHLEEFKKAFVCLPEYVGMIGIIEGKSIVMDVCGVNNIFHKQFPSLIGGLAIDALDKGFCDEVKKTKDLTYRDFLREIIKAKKENIGGSVGIEANKVIGRALISADVVIHLEAFAK